MLYYKPIKFPLASSSKQTVRQLLTNYPKFKFIAAAHDCIPQYLICNYSVFICEHVKRGRLNAQTRQINMQTLVFFRNLHLEHNSLKQLPLYSLASLHITFSEKLSLETNYCQC